MIAWLDLVFVSASRVLHSAEPRTDKFAFQLGQDNPQDKSIFRHFVWTRDGHQRQHQPSWGSGSVVVAYQPPFILTEQDLQEFVACKAVRQSTESNDICSRGSLLSSRLLI